MMEPIRTQIDKAVKKAITLKLITEDNFKVYQGQYQLEYRKAPVFTGYIMEQLMEEKERMFLYVRNYYRSFMKSKDTFDYPFYNDEE